MQFLGLEPQQARQATIFDTLVERNPAGVRSFLAARGQLPSQNEQEMKARLYGLFMQDKQGTFLEMLRLHPDAQMILDELAPNPEEKPKPKKAGCSCAGNKAQAQTLTLDALGINTNLVNGALMLFALWLLIKIVKG